VLFLALACVVAWMFLGGSEPPPKPTVPVATAPSIVPPAPVATAPVLPAPPPLASAPVPSPTALARAPSAPVAAAPAPRPAPRPARREAPATPAAPTPGVPPAEDRIYSMSELPETIRRELPKIAYGGGSYSPDKASRLAFLNGQVFHEGDTIAPGLVLRQVRQKGAILAYKGYRFEIGP
jgi:general secretion pathway protein B